MPTPITISTGEPRWDKGEAAVRRDGGDILADGDHDEAVPIPLRTDGSHANRHLDLCSGAGSKHAQPWSRGGK